MITFAYPLLLLLLVLPLLLAVYFVRFRRRPSVTVSDAGSFRRCGSIRNKMDFCDWCMVLAVVMTIVAAARPRVGNSRSIVRADGIDIVVALDLSGSMQAIDVPESIKTNRQLIQSSRNGTLKDRLQSAKKAIGEFIDKRPNDRIGIIGFADRAYTFSPPTFDHNWLKDCLARLETNMIGDATSIAAPLASGVRRLQNSAAPRRVLVLFTDGANTASSKITPEKAAEIAKENNVAVYTVGIGSDRAVAYSRESGVFLPARADFDAAMLQNIASLTGGTYYHASDAEKMREALSRIDSLEKSSLEAPRFTEYREYFYYPALAAAGLILISAAAWATWKLRLP